MSKLRKAAGGAGEIGRRMTVVGGSYLKDRVRPAPAVDAAEIPTSRHQLTREWLDSVLCRNAPGARVASFDTADVSAGTSTRWSLSVSYNDAGREAGLPTEVFAKTTLAYRQRLLLGFTGVISGEPKFFSVFRPQVDIEAPSGYFGAVDDRSWRSISLMEDIASSKGAEFYAPATYVSPDQMKDLLANLARMHGRFWRSPDLGRAKLRDTSTFLHSNDRLIGFTKRARVGAERAAKVIPKELLDRTDECCRGVLRGGDIAAEGSRTLLHGDPHIGNTYRTAEGKMGFTDWQVIMQGGWAWDVAYLLTPGLSIEDRRKFDRELVAFYLEQLAQAGGEPAEFDQAWREFLQQTIYPYLGWTFTYGRAPWQPRMQPDDICLEIIERSAAAIVDHDALSTLR